MSLECSIKKEWPGFDLDIELSLGCERLGLLGHSGSGKSQTLQCLAGLTTPDSGSIRIDGRLVYDSSSKTNIPTAKRRTGLLFQQYALFPHLTVSENIIVGIKSQSRGHQEAELNHWLSKFRLMQHASKYPNHLSGGQQQRVALARCLSARPRILLLDEPFAAVDMTLKSSLMTELINDLRDYPGSMIYVSHDMDEVYRVCDKIAVVDEGRIKEVGQRQQVMTVPRTVAAARLQGLVNLSRIEPLENNRVLAVDWNLVVDLPETCRTLPAWIGIRPSDLKLMRISQMDQDDTTNRFSLKFDRFEETRFELLLHGAVNPGTEHPRQMTWQIARHRAKWLDNRPGDLAVELPPEKILLLENEG